MPELFLDGAVTLYAGDCRDVLRELPDCSIDAVVSDPPYALVSIAKRFGKAGSAPARGGDVYARASAGFMGKDWDTGETVFAVEFWHEVFRVLKPGGHVVAFSGTRTYHRLAVAIEDAGFEIRDMVAWLYGSGFPKSHDVSKGIDKRLGGRREKVKYKARPSTSGTMAGSSDTRPWIEESRAKGYHEIDGKEPATSEAAEWHGWGTALKPAQEPICLARKPIIGTVAENVLEHGTGALNIDGCRIAAADGELKSGTYERRHESSIYDATTSGLTRAFEYDGSKGRWPANVIHDGSDEVIAAFPDAGGQQAPSIPGGGQGVVYGDVQRTGGMLPRDDTGSAARFFYSAKADGDDRLGSKHPTVKPVDLMQYLLRLVTPPGGLALDPFAGSGTTGEAAWREGMRAILIERDPDYLPDIRRRMEIAPQHSSARKRAAAKPKQRPQAGGDFLSGV